MTGLELAASYADSVAMYYRLEKALEKCRQHRRAYRHQLMSMGCVVSADVHTRKILVDVAFPAVGGYVHSTFLRVR